MSRLLALASILLFPVQNAPAMPATQDEAVLRTRTALVHYATDGATAPPVVDSDREGTPDYIQLIADAADAALNAFQTFNSSTSVGPRAPLEIYVGPLEPGTFGETGRSSLTNEPIVAISNRIELGANADLLRRTVAHEVFHVIQSRYVEEMPLWIAEGTATAMAATVFPGTVDPIAAEYERRWRQHPSRALDDESRGCERCYGGSLWWLFLSARSEGVLPKLFAHFAAHPDFQNDRGIRALRGVLSETRGSLRDLYADFALSMYRQPGRLGLAPQLTARRGAARSLRLAPLASSYMPVWLGTAARVTLVLSVRGAPIDVSLVTARPSAAVYARFKVTSARAIVLPARLGKHGLVAIYSNGGNQTSRLRITARRLQPTHFSAFLADTEALRSINPRARVLRSRCAEDPVHGRLDEWLRGSRLGRPSVLERLHRRPLHR